MAVWLASQNCDLGWTYSKTATKMVIWSPRRNPPLIRLVSSFAHETTPTSLNLVHRHHPARFVLNVITSFAIVVKNKLFTIKLLLLLLLLFQTMTIPITFIGYISSLCYNVYTCTTNSRRHCIMNTSFTVCISCV